MTARLPRPLALLGACLTALALHGCGGDGDATEPGPEPAADLCAGTPAVAEQTGYPVYGIADREIDEALLCQVIAHYEAGYAITGTQDVDPWNDPDPASVAHFSAPILAQDPPPGDEEILHQLPVDPTPPTPQVTAGLEGFVLARAPNGNGEPWECSIVGATPEVVQAGLDDCLVRLRSEASAAAPEAGAAGDVQARKTRREADTGVSASVMGDAKLDSSLWTSIGTFTHTIKGYTDDWWRWKGQAHVGTATASFTVYRLNSAEASDYYLVKAVWSLKPEYSEPCSRLDGCRFFNNQHRLAFSLQRRHGTDTEDGTIESYAPQTVARHKTHTAKFGGGLKVGMGDKGASGEASVSGEISTSYTYDAASIIAGVTENKVDFRLSHATSVGTLSFGGDLWDEDPTTMGGVTTTAWALYKFPVSRLDQSADASIVLNIDEFRGTFGNWTGIKATASTMLHDYWTSAFTRTFSLPHFSVRLQDASGAFVAPPLDPAEPLRLRRGQTVRFAVDAGGPSDDPKATSHPITLSWQLANLPSYLVASNTSGNQRSTISITARQTATPGTLDYLRFNTSPRGAAPGLQTGDIAVPVLIVD